MTHPTNEELDEMARDLCHTGELSMPYRCKISDAICALRTQLAKAKAEKESLGRELNLARYGQPDFSWQVHKEAIAEANARADRADAALAAQIEVDAGIAEDAWLDGVPVAEISAAIRAHSHDRSALDRMLAEASEKALREAVSVANDWQNETGTDIAAAARICPQIADAILALIEAPNAQP